MPGIERVVLGLAMVLSAGSAGAAGPGRWSAHDERAPAHSSRIIVKYRPTVQACAHCLLARGVPFVGLTGTGSIDALNRRYGVRGARALFVEDHRIGGERRTDYFARAAAVHDQFHARSARVPATAALPDLSNVYVLDLPRGADVVEAAARYAADPNVEYAQPDYRVHATLVPNDPFFWSGGTWKQSYPDLWGLQITQAATAWDVSNGGGTVIAVIDTGVDHKHKDLAVNMWSNPREIPDNKIDDDGNGFVDDVVGWDFVDDDNKPLDRNGHGTHVAGIAAAVGNNGVGVIGMGWGAQIMAVRGLDAKGNGWESTLAKAVVYAAQNGADVLNNSYGGFNPFLLDGTPTVMSDAVATATALGAIVVAAAGNDAGSVNSFSPAGVPQSIAVGATQPDDSLAGFSNRGRALSVTAPGVDILSLKARYSSRVRGKPTAKKYLRLSGTSMAAPHVAGLAAALLSAYPDLTPDEVRWHLELSANQPGYPGYEGQRFNPYFGWGRINAADVFNAPPVTTRIRTDPIKRHGFAGGVLPNVAALDFLFTTLDPVAWTLSGPSWLLPESAVGSGPAQVTISLDGSGLALGSYAGDLVLSAPGAVDGGGALSVAVQMHRDERVGDEILVADSAPYAVNDGARIASDGSGALIVWVDDLLAITAARVDDAGNLGTRSTVHRGSCVQASCPFKDSEALAVGSDGTNFLVVWREYVDTAVWGRTFKTVRDEYVKAIRVGPSGEPLDASPVILASQRQESPQPTYFPSRYYGVGAAFDGTAYTVMWGDVDHAPSPDAAQFFVSRITAGGSASPARQIYPTASTGNGFIEPRLACVSGQGCLFAWVNFNSVSPEGHYIRDVVGMRLMGDALIDDAPIRLLANISFPLDMAASPDGYLVLDNRTIWNGNSFEGYNLIAGRVTAAGVPLDLDGFQVNHSPAEGNAYIQPIGAIFDGTNYAVAFNDLNEPWSSKGRPIFGARIGTDGSVLDNEPIGLLLNGGGTALMGAIAPTQRNAVLVWMDSRVSTRPGFPYPQAIYAQRVLTHPPPP